MKVWTTALKAPISRTKRQWILAVSRMAGSTAASSVRSSRFGPKPVGTLSQETLNIDTQVK
jgi:hypothetical protein